MCVSFSTWKNADCVSSGSANRMSACIADCVSDSTDHMPLDAACLCHQTDTAEYILSDIADRMSEDILDTYYQIMQSVSHHTF
jgi:hypothetical protein